MSEAEYAPSVLTRQPVARRRKWRFHVECPSARHFGNGNTENAARRRCNEFCDCKGEKLVIDNGEERA